jgi:DNA-binding MarR family transcriptional regulator
VANESNNFPRSKFPILLLFSKSRELKWFNETGDYTMQQIANAFGVHYSTVSRAINNSSLKND